MMINLKVRQTMKKLLLFLSLVALPLTAIITWSPEKKQYISMSFLWDDKMSDQRYHELALIFNQLIGYSIINEGGVWSVQLIDFIKFLRDDCTREAFVLSHDIEEFLEQYDDLD